MQTNMKIGVAAVCLLASMQYVRAADDDCSEKTHVIWMGITMIVGGVLILCLLLSNALLLIAVLNGKKEIKQIVQERDDESDDEDNDYEKLDLTFNDLKYHLVYKAYSSLWAEVFNNLFRLEFDEGAELNELKAHINACLEIGLDQAENDDDEYHMRGYQVQSFDSERKKLNVIMEEAVAETEKDPRQVEIDRYYARLLRAIKRRKDMIVKRKYLVSVLTGDRCKNIDLLYPHIFSVSTDHELHEWIYGMKEDFEMDVEPTIEEAKKFLSEDKIEGIYAYIAEEEKKKAEREAEEERLRLEEERIAKEEKEARKRAREEKRNGGKKAGKATKQQDQETEKDAKEEEEEGEEKPTIEDDVKLESVGSMVPSNSQD